MSNGLEYEERQALKRRICEWLFSPKWTDTHSEFDEIEALVDMVEEELKRSGNDSSR